MAIRTLTPSLRIDLQLLFRATKPSGRPFTQAEMCTALDICPNTFIKICKQLSLSRPRGLALRILNPGQETALVRDYLTRQPDGTWLGAKLLGNKYGVTDTAVHHILKRHHVTMRSIKEAHAHGKRCKPIVNLPPQGESPPPCRCGCRLPVEWSRPRKRWAAYRREHLPNPSEKLLRKLYCAKMMTAVEIGRQLNCTDATVRRYMKKYGIPVRDHSITLRTRGSVQGARNPAWKGGVTPERQRLYKTPKWKAFVQAVWRRDSFACQRCGTGKLTHRGLHAHHIKPWADAPRLRMAMANVITLCNRCHVWVHSAGNTQREFLKVSNPYRTGNSRALAGR